MRLRGLTIVPISPDRYCPYCKRRLVKMNEDGTFDLAGGASVRLATSVNPHELPEDGVVEGWFEEVACLARICQMRRSWESQPPRQRRMFYVSCVLAALLFLLAFIQIIGGR